VAEGILRIHTAGAGLRERTAAWFARNAEHLSLESSLATVLAGYARAEHTEGREDRRL
jgi:hypothetical protein